MFLNSTHNVIPKVFAREIKLKASNKPNRRQQKRQRGVCAAVCFCVCVFESVLTGCVCVCAVCAFVCFGLFSVYLCVSTAHRHFPLLKWLLIDKKQKKRSGKRNA